MAVGYCALSHAASAIKGILLKRLFREPLLHFIALALVIFAIYGVLGPTGAEKPDTIVVTASKIEQLAAVFAKTWQRSPSSEELKGLIDDYVKEEIYVREALALGLDEDDTVIRRRLRLKMEFMNDASADDLTPTDTDLEAYLKAHSDKFAVEPMTAFQQIFLDPKRHGDNLDPKVAAIFDILTANPATDPTTLGDASLLPSRLPLTDAASIDQTFGPAFAAAIDKVQLGMWTGPITSSFGAHVVYVSERKAGRLPALSDVREAVTREWLNDKRRELEDARLNALLERYQVTIEGSPGADTVP